MKGSLHQRGEYDRGILMIVMNINEMTANAMCEIYEMEWISIALIKNNQCDGWWIHNYFICLFISTLSPVKLCATLIIYTLIKESKINSWV